MISSESVTFNFTSMQMTYLAFRAIEREFSGEQLKSYLVEVMPWSAANWGRFNPAWMLDLTW